MFSPTLRLLLITGVLGGFTTFSAFAYETIFLMKTGDNFSAFANVALQVIGGLAAVWAGQLLVRGFTA
ncbi:MAG: CrcB family protein [Deltaproteobacteria bacterium]|nr:CrcB family protein [Deltaproteobacteria bacterium]